MSDFTSVLGIAAGILSASANIPQALKTWRSGETDDLSLRMLSLLFTGLVLWSIYGFVKPDWFVAVANFVSASSVGYVLAIKAWNLWHS